jgi:hypothetical protein
MAKTSISQRGKHLQGIPISKCFDENGKYSWAMVMKLGSGSVTQSSESKDSTAQPAQASQSHGTWLG